MANPTKISSKQMCRVCLSDSILNNLYSKESETILKQLRTFLFIEVCF